MADSNRQSGVEPPDYLSVGDLEALGLSLAWVRHRCPWAVELVALDGSPCWSREDLVLLPGERVEGNDQ
jgi:hypothetical protein